MAQVPLGETDQLTVETALKLIRRNDHEWYTSSAFDQLFGAVHIARALGEVPSFAAGHLSAALELRASVISIMQKMAWLHGLNRTGDLDDGKWMYFAASDIVAFHVLLRSLLDEVGAVIANVALKRGETPESFAAIRMRLVPGSPKEKRTRKHLGDQLASAIRSCDWFEDLRDVRDDIVHRGAQTLVFFGSDRILFQVHLKFAWRVLVPAVMFNENVADWTMYSSLVVARIMVFLDLFADAVFNMNGKLQEHRSMSVSSIHPGYATLHAGLSQLLTD